MKKSVLRQIVKEEISKVLNENQKFKTPGVEQAYDNLEKSVIAWRKATMPMKLQGEEEFKSFETAFSKMIQSALAKDVRSN